ncbi:DNA-protecting protein DprA [Acidaminococcus sp. AM05-11]|uniref:DNA-processing protein DprA n=1 Tax=Acidaminococcus sp. AM05-11 TaxID=2291997 RepID=UPI000E49808B|nr:DNA-processing protein DprA [Acidaminococcus sp. AM05-11]RHK01457.1 DNA-protecting protein DprA [Acidaminococcus sp. AM05-11]
MERYYYAALADLLGYQAPNRVRELVSYFGSAKAAFRAGSRDLKASGLLKEGLLSYYEEMYQGDLPEQIYDYCETHQVAVVTEYSEEYPPGLRELSSPPAVLYRKGTFPSWKRTLGVVGSRKATAYGLENARSFARYLAGQGVTVVSGGAFGIDAAAHQGALDGGGCTVAVLAGGFQHLYPAAHSRLFGQIAQHGALVTEYAPWVEPLQKRFPLRNRLVVGLCSGVLVVEAALKSGAMITARLAAEENRDVYAIPGLIHSATSKGTHQLIRDGALLVDGPEQLLQEAFPQCAVPAKKETELSLFDQLPSAQVPQAQQVFSWLQEAGSQSMEQLAEHFSWSLAELSSVLLQLEISGAVRQGPGNRYMLVV